METLPRNTGFDKCINRIRGGKEVLDALKFPEAHPYEVTFQQQDTLYFSVPHPEIQPQTYVAAFDIDWTVTASENKAFPNSADPDDIVLLPERQAVLTEVFKRGYTLVFFTNQKVKKKAVIAKRVARVTTFLMKLGLPAYAFIATGDDKYRKPNVGMWEKFTELVPNIDYFFFVGDAMGRPQDFSDSDLIFGRGIGAQDIYNPEEFFPPSPLGDLTPGTKSMVIMVGVQGSGKTTFGDRVLAPMGYNVLSRDKLGATKAQFNKLITQDVSQYDRVAIDATNGKLETRQELYKIASEHGMRVIVLYFLRNGKDWNSLREGKAKIHLVAIHSYYKHMIPPTVGEGGENLPERVVPISHWT